MSTPSISEGDLLAYLDEVDLPHVAQALSESLDLQRELAELEQLDDLLRQKFGQQIIPDPQDLVDVLTGQATNQQRLLVAAYERRSLRWRQEKALLEKELALLQSPPRPRFRLPNYTALLQTAASGLRSALSENEAQPTFQVAEMQAEVTLAIIPGELEQWQITGYVTQKDQPVVNARVTLRAEHIKPRRRSTDTAGFFRFRALSAGHYHLRIALTEGAIVIPVLELKDTI